MKKERRRKREREKERGQFYVGEAYWGTGDLSMYCTVIISSPNN
jgi:hypothetical protein